MVDEDLIHAPKPEKVWPIWPSSFSNNTGVQDELARLVNIGMAW